MGYDEIYERLSAYTNTLNEIDHLTKVIKRLKEKSVCIDTILPKENLVLSSIGNNARYEKIIEEIADIEHTIKELHERSLKEEYDAGRLINLIGNTRQRQSLKMFFLYGMNNEEIALDLGCDVRTVGKYKRKGIEYIVHIMGMEGQAEA